MKKRILACIVCLCVVLSIAQTIVFAAEERVTIIDDNGFRVWSDDGKEFIKRTSSTEGNAVVFDQSGTYYVTGSTSNYRIIVSADGVIIVLNGATIKPTTRGAAIGVAEECAEETKVTIMLSEGSVNEVSGDHDAGINNLGRELKIVGDGTLNAKGGSCRAGIGGGSRGNGSNITISGSATVNATGGRLAAGIGGGAEGNGSNITISGNARVYTRSGEYGAGIGGGNKGNGSNITISGNANVKAEGNVGPGIGGGHRGNATNITISNHATVNATCDFDGAGIGGGGNKGNGSNITISGNANVKAEAAHGAGIGGGWDGNATNITISDHATVNATGGEDGAGIGGGHKGNATNITISDHATVNATGGHGEPRGRGIYEYTCDGGAGIGGGKEGNGENIEISGSAIVNATGNKGAAGIGSGAAGNGSNITISGNPTINVTSDENGFGFGNSLGKSQITISGGTIKTLNCIPFSDRPDLSHYNCDILLNGEICVYRSDDTYKNYARQFEIIPGA